MTGMNALGDRMSVAHVRSLEQKLKGRQSQQAGDRREFRLMLNILFGYFLLLSLVSRLLPQSWRPFSCVPGQRPSVVGDARRAAHEITPFIFMR